MINLSLMEITKVLLFEMYNMGKINPDLLVLLIEPTVYILMALCERADVDFTIDGSIGEEEELDGTVVFEQTRIYMPVIPTLTPMTLT